jgi:3-hydroxyisobutyrate dehydrogenase-like beta-hydroxyacid dehydrogenase
VPVISNPKTFSFFAFPDRTKEKVYMRVAFLGLGIMGQSMATNLVKAGHAVTVWNRTPGKLVEGAGVAPTPKAAAEGAEVVWLCVSDTDAVESVVFGLEGAEQSLAEGAIIADSSTISPSATLKFAERLRAKGVAWVDAPMTGSKIGARDGTLVFIVGGDEAPVERLKPLFAAMGKKIFRMGETSKGQATKLAMNLQIAMIFEGFAEALTLAAKLGVDAQQLLSLIEATMVRSGVVEYKAPFILQRDFTPNFPLRLMHKDIRLALEAAKEARVKLPGLETVEEIYEMATEDGHQDLDYAATLTLLEKWAGVQVKGKAA